MCVLHGPTPRASGGSIKLTLYFVQVIAVGEKREEWRLMARRQMTIAEKWRCCVCPVWTHLKGTQGIDAIDPVR